MNCLSVTYSCALHVFMSNRNVCIDCKQDKAKSARILCFAAQAEEVLSLTLSCDQHKAYIRSVKISICSKHQ